jgi:Glycosyl hydrolase family 63 C-terminal domain
MSIERAAAATTSGAAHDGGPSSSFAQDPRPLPTALSTAEHRRLDEARSGVKWRRWGTYLAERQWGTVREDYSANGDAWNYFPHEHARVRAYRWGEDGLLGLSDSRGILNFGVALWNGKDPYLKERLFGLSGPEGNHGESVGELYWYVDGTPTHSYSRALYKYPQNEFPYERLREMARNAGKNAPSPRLQDTGIFDEDRYFDVELEYAKAGPDDILVRITVTNRGPDPASIDVLPTFWYRNTWAWDGPKPRNPNKPELRAVYSPEDGSSYVEGTDPYHGKVKIWFDGAKELLFTDNETNTAVLYNTPNKTSYVKDAFHQYVVKRQRAAVSPARAGTKTAGHWTEEIPAGESRIFRARFSTAPAPAGAAFAPFADFDVVCALRRREADAFYAAVAPPGLSEEAANVHRQALAGLLWSKQYYAFDVNRWLTGDPGAPPPPAGRKNARNREWRHLFNSEVLSMPDKWEYPWYAAWDLAFHCIPLALVDPDLAKEQLVLLTREWYMHPNGQLPAYEWAFGDVNPPVHAWAALRVYQIDRRRTGKADRDFLESVFLKLMLNFTWWVNRKDTSGNNVFQGGFLGLDNIGVFDRSNALPQGGLLEQADATSWMGMYCLNLLAIALELATHSPSYQDVANKFFEHFLLISHAMCEQSEEGGVRMWDEEDGFFYDMLHLPGRGNVPMRVRSMVGLIPIFAVETIEEAALERFPAFVKRARWFMSNRPEFSGKMDAVEMGTGKRRLLSILDRDRLARVLSRVLDENEFLSPYGIRALSRSHMEEPYELELDGQRHRVDYEPGESSTGLFGGNSNWRGPVWFPVNYLMIEALQKYHHYYGETFRIECPTGSGRYMNLWEVASELSQRLTSLFMRDANGRRPADGGATDCKMQTDPHFRDLVTFFEYFHGENGTGLGATHQTGWTALVAKLITQSPKWGQGRGKK